MSDIVAKVRQGTKSDATDLCRSCRYCTIIQGGRESQEYRYCNEIGKPLHARVAECSSYYNHNLPSMKTLYETAYILDTSKHEVGFMPYKKWAKKDPDKNYTPYDPDDD